MGKPELMPQTNVKEQYVQHMSQTTSIISLPLLMQKWSNKEKMCIFVAPEWVTAREHFHTVCMSVSMSYCCISHTALESSGAEDWISLLHLPQSRFIAGLKWALQYSMQELLFSKCRHILWMDVLPSIQTHNKWSATPVKHIKDTFTFKLILIKKHPLAFSITTTHRIVFSSQSYTINPYISVSRLTV